MESSCRQGGVMNKEVKTRLEKPTETDDLNKEELTDSSLIAGKLA